MKSNFTVEFYGDYICIRNEQDYVINHENVSSFWELVVESCEQYGCTKVLREARIASRELDTWQINWVDTLNAVRKGSRAVPGLRLAYCFTNYIENELTKFYIHSAAIEEVDIKYFSDRNEALRWLGVKES